MIDYGYVCGCHEHPTADTTPNVIGRHQFILHTDDDVPGEPVHWRWLCGCQRGAGRWNAQSDAAAYHSWLRHVQAAKR